MKKRPGQVRDAIITFLTSKGGEASTSEIHAGVEKHLGEKVAPSSVRSYLNLNTADLFLRVGRGQYRLRAGGAGRR